MSKFTKKKYTNDALLIAVCILAIIVTKAMPRKAETTETVANLPSLAAATNSQRLEFLRGYKVDCESEPCEIRDVVIPLEFNATFLKYEAVLKKQGLSLENYKGETVRKYSYELKGESALAELLVHNDKIVACAVLSLSEGGGFSRIIP
jgi:hypothetical protein